MKLTMRLYWATLILICALSGCSPPRVQIVEPASAAHIQKLSSEGQFYDAFLLVPKHHEEVEAIEHHPTQDLGSEGDHAFDSLLLDTATDGEAQWDKILNEPRLPNRFKVDLIVEIISVHGDNGRISPALRTRLAKWEKLVELAIQELNRMNDIGTQPAAGSAGRPSAQP
jgi:hypothetical protein